MTDELLIKDVRMLGGGITDLLVRNGQIVALEPNLAPSQPDTQVIHAERRLLFPGFVDAHAHMDKTLIGLGWYRNEVGPSLIEKIENERAVRRERDTDAHQQSARQARLALAAGTTHTAC